jgi:subtilisin family serine protease
MGWPQRSVGSFHESYDPEIEAMMTSHWPRYFIRFPEPNMADQAMAFFRGPEKATTAYRPHTDARLLIAPLAPEEIDAFRRSEAEVYEDFQFKHCGPIIDDMPPPKARYWEPEYAGPLEQEPPKGLNEVLEQINAPKAWEKSTGEMATVVVIDTGIDQGLLEIDHGRRHPLNLESAFKDNHWLDRRGHGSMCAAIAAGSSAAGGRFEGVAPRARVLSARTHFLYSDIFLIVDELSRAHDEGRLTGPIVVNNSYGAYACLAPFDERQRSLYERPFVEAIERGMTFVFAAGNNHVEICDHDPKADGPNSIWALNSLDQVLTIGTVNENLSNQDPGTPHVNSSRGPGEWSMTRTKPDCVTPTYGEVVWGTEYRRLGWWGTSGAAPQVAGLCALLLSINPHLTPAQVRTIVHDSCRPLDGPPTCVGRGVIDCAAAVAMV